MLYLNNFFLGINNPYNLRGIPTKDRTFDDNICVRARESYGSCLTNNRYTGQLLTNVKVGKNLWNIANSNGTASQKQSIKQLIK
ncbi:MAG TPA: hypothetical protein DCY74_05790 [Clostridiales bacterium]|nr:hypothetical protein [Clostridiales bacterium]HBE13666.1 hypothetical protein [Clostridiales bacterium]HCG35006.1 hypothetical protein [Clostridiales bacterium]